MDDRFVGLAIAALWLSWLFYWWRSARDVKPTSRQESGRDQVTYRLPLVLAILCLSAPGWIPQVFHRRFVPAGAPAQVAGLVLLAAGLGFTVWARRHLGRNWSASVVVKEDHALVRSGPYRQVRHPIYTGMLLAFLGTAVAVGEWRGLMVGCWPSSPSCSRAAWRRPEWGKPSPNTRSTGVTPHRSFRGYTERYGSGGPAVGVPPRAVPAPASAEA